MIVSIFEATNFLVTAGFELLTGQILDREQYTLWFSCNIAFAGVGTLAMALFYYLDWRRVPAASSLAAAPSFYVSSERSSDRSSVAMAVKLVAQQEASSEQQ